MTTTVTNTPQPTRLEVAAAEQASSLLMQIDPALLSHILTRMDIKDATAHFSTCRYAMMKHFENRALWMNLFKSRFPNHPLPQELEPFEAYRDLHPYHFRLKQDIYTSLSLQQDPSIFHVHNFCDQKIIDNARFYCPSENGVDIFDLNTGALLNTLTGLGAADSFTVADQNLITVSPQRTIGSFRHDTGECLSIRPVPDHCGVFKAIPGGRILSLQEDLFLEVLDARNLIVLNKLKLPEELWFSFIVGSQLTSMCFTADKLVFGHEDGTVWVAHLHNNLVQTFTGHTTQINALAVGDGRLASSSIDRQVKIWDIATEECVRTLDLNQEEGAPSLAIEEGTLFIGSFQPKIWIYALETGAHLGTEEAMHSLTIVGQQSAIFLTFAGRKLILEDQRGKIQVWNYQVGNAQVFREIAELLKTSTPETVQEILNRFDRMPHEQKNKIYVEFAKILGMAPDDTSVMEPLKDIFLRRTLKDIFLHSKSGLVFVGERVQAIENYLAKEESLP